MAKVLTINSIGNIQEIENRFTISLNNQNLTAGNAIGTDYILFCSGNCTITLLTAIGNTNLYTIINEGTGVITVIFTAGQNANNSTSVAINTEVSLNFISNNSNYRIF